MKANLKERNSNIELMRIVLIFMVLTLHYFNRQMGGGLNATNGTLNYNLACIIESMSIIAVNGFIVITGFL